MVIAGLLTGIPGCGGGGGAGGSSVTPNPQPVLTSLAPTKATAGGAALVLTATGSDFVASSTVYWNGNPRQTTYASATSLTAQINATDIASAGSASVTVVTPVPGGGTSAAQSFTIAAALNVPVQQIAPGGTMSQSTNYQLVGTLGSPPDSTVATSQHYLLQGGLTGAVASIP